MKHPAHTHSKGFTLVETLVAVAILVAATTGAFGAAGGGLISSTYSKDQVIAFYLAGEAVEEIRNLRDQNGLTHPGSDWLGGIADAGDPCAFGNTCKVDVANEQTSPVLSVCPGGVGTCPVLNLDSVNGFYGYSSASGWLPTQFRREVRLTAVNDHEASILVSVTWKKGLIDRTFEVRENIFDWQ